MRVIIHDLLWIGNAADVRDVQQVLAQGITAVVDLAMDEPPVLYPRDITYCRLPLVDGQDNSSAVIRASIQSVHTFVRMGVSTLVGCSGGMSRSLGIAAAAIALLNRSDADEELKHISDGGPHDVSPALWRDIKNVLDDLMIETS